MKLWRVENGYLGNGSVYVLVVAATEQRAIDLAVESYRTEYARSHDSRVQDEDYFARHEMVATLIAETLTIEWVSAPQD